MSSGYSLRELPIPGVSFGDENEDDSRSTSRWDSMYYHQPLPTFPLEHRRTLCSHAVSIGSTVFGISNQLERSSVTVQNSEIWWTWQRSLEHISKQTLLPAGNCSSEVCSVEFLASNTSGTVIAAATDTGMVALLRGSDGAVLATRKVSSSRPSSPIRLTWISRSICGSTDDDPCDTLFIEVPIGADDFIGSDDNAEPSNCNSQLIVVTNIQGLQLNHPNAAIVSEAAGQTQIIPIPKNSGMLSNFDLRAITACGSTTSNVLRLVACDYDSQLTVFDFHCSTQEVQLIREGISLGVDDSTMKAGWCIDFELGLFISQSGTPLVLASALLHSYAPMLFWFNPMTMQTACQFALHERGEESTSDASSSLSTRSNKVVAIEPLCSWNISETFAVAVAVKSIIKKGTSTISSSTNIHILQVLIDEIMGLTVVFSPHLLYTIPVQESISSITLAAMVPKAGPFSFRLQVWNDSKKNLCVYKEFQPNESSSTAIGTIRSLILRQDFDKAEKLIAHMSVETLITEPYANFHPSEVAFHRLLRSWQHPTDHAPEEAQLCLRQLASGAIATAGPNNTKAFDLLLHSVGLISENASTSGISIESFIGRLELMKSTLLTVQENTPSKPHSEIVKTHLDAIIKQMAALNLLASITSADSSYGYPQLVTPFSGIRSIRQLYEICMQEHNFIFAELVYQMSRKDVHWSSTCLVKPLILNVKGFDVKPENFLFILTDVLFPNLRMNDSNLWRLKVWTCQIADSLYDAGDNCVDLDSVILLLETVDTEIRKLRLRSFSSYRFSLRYDDKSMERNNYMTMSRLSPRLETSLEHCDSFSSSRDSQKGSFSFSSSSKDKPISNDTNIRRDELSLATILEIGALQRGLRNATSVDTADDDSVHEKLVEARCLQFARDLGLTRRVTSLREFSSYGGSERIAKELVCLFVSTASTHENRIQFLTDRVRKFCEQFSVDFDQAIYDCAIEICRDKVASSCSIEQCCSIVRCCSSANVRCKITLVLLRAALSCGCTSTFLLDLSKEAIEICGPNSSSLRSELEEARRLLQIDGIIVRYCGFGARELFRLENPRHSLQLLSFVTKQIDEETVVDDMISLCDGFNHLCRRKASCQLLENAILHSDTDAYVLKVFQNLIRKDSFLAESSLVDTIYMSESILDECCASLKGFCLPDELTYHRQRARFVCTRVGSLLLCALENGISLLHMTASFLNSADNLISIEQLRNFFSRNQSLQCAFSVFTSMGTMASTSAIINTVVDCIESSLPQICSDGSCGEFSQHKFYVAKSVCSLLTAGTMLDEHDAWAVATTQLIAAKANKWHENFLMRFIDDVGMLSDMRRRVHSQACISSFSTLCQSTGYNDATCPLGIRRLVVLSSILRNCLTFHSRGQDLVTVAAMSSRFELIFLVCSRCDEGFGDDVVSLRRKIDYQCLSQTPTLPSSSVGSIDSVKGLVYRPCLHPSWYISDGILLPPAEASWKSFSCILLDEATFRIFDFVNARGAHSLALRILCELSNFRRNSMFSFVDDVRIDELNNNLQQTTLALAERNLGGTVTGITSSAIDSQQAVSFLWVLPINQALYMLKCCLPSALKTRNFERLFILSNIETVAGSEIEDREPELMLSTSWKKQDKVFFDNCHQIATKAKWWSILQQIGVEFEPQKFTDPFDFISTNSVDQSKEAEASYAVHCLRSFILLSTQTLVTDSKHMIWFATSYADTFGVPLQLAVNEYIIFLFSTSNYDPSLFREEQVCDFLHLLNPPVERIEILRQCLRNLDLQSFESFNMEYELYNLVLRLYHESVLFVIENDHTIPTSLLEAELESVDRRRDALIILSAFFQDSRSSSRPKFSSFFPPFGETLGHCPAVLPCGILGKNFSVGEVFDPLEKLEDVFLKCHDIRAVTALAPLCEPLGIPNGYIHARSLVARFLFAKSNHIEYPSFDNDVFPVLNRIGSPLDKANLAEWCANQYKNNAEEKLKCLTIVLQNSMEASSEIEHRRRHLPNDVLLRQLERDMLEKVKQITAVKATLSDCLLVKELLLSSCKRAPRDVRLLVEVLVVNLDQYTLENPDVTPESLIDFLYISGSHIASNKYLNCKSNFSIVTFRQFCFSVYSVCQGVAVQYSHIDLLCRTRHLVHHLLFYGDIDNSALYNRPSQASTQQFAHRNNEDAAMSFFVMDSKKSNVFSIKAERDSSEDLSRLAALRVAFVLGSLSQSNHLMGGVDDKENMDADQHTDYISSKHMSLLSHHQTKRELRQYQYVFDVGLELLQIVFATSSLPLDIFCRVRSDDSVFISCSNKNENSSIITFAMRHRALLAASILCPHEVLDKSLQCEGVLQSSSHVERCTLRQCLFGAFVAKEIEELGLPLPHSDLLQLSSMNFLSYARGLWRDYREDPVIQRSNARFFVLLVEMSLHSECCDFVFVSGLFQEMIERKLLRPLLLCLERISEILHQWNVESTFPMETFRKAANFVTDGILYELGSVMRDDSIQADEAVILRTVEKVFSVSSIVTDFTSFVSHCKKYLYFLEDTNESLTIRRDLLRIVSHFRDKAKCLDGSLAEKNAINK